VVGVSDKDILALADESLEKAEKASFAPWELTVNGHIKAVLRLWVRGPGDRVRDGDCGRVDRVRLREE